MDRRVVDVTLQGRTFSLRTAEDPAVHRFWHELSTLAVVETVYEQLEEIPLHGARAAATGLHHRTRLASALQSQTGVGLRAWAANRGSLRQENWNSLIADGAVFAANGALIRLL